MLAATGKRSARRNVLSRVQRTAWACQRESERGEVGEMGAGKENRDVPGSRPGSTGLAIVPRPTGQVHWAGGQIPASALRGPRLPRPACLPPAPDLDLQGWSSQGNRQTCPLRPQPAFWVSVCLSVRLPSPCSGPGPSTSSLHPDLSCGSFWFQWPGKIVHRWAFII